MMSNKTLLYVITILVLLLATLAVWSIHAALIAVVIIGALCLFVAYGPYEWVLTSVLYLEKVWGQWTRR